MEEEDKQTKVQKWVTYWLYDASYYSDQWRNCRAYNCITLAWEWLGNYSSYKTQKDIAKKLTQLNPYKSHSDEAEVIWHFTHTMKKGDIVFAKDGEDRIVGYGVVTSGYEFTPGSKNYQNQRKVEWKGIGEWKIKLSIQNSILINLTGYFGVVRDIKAIINNKSLVHELPNLRVERYTKEDFLDEVFMTEEQVTRLVQLLRRKKNIILQGAPGVGKTFSAKRLAYMMMGEKDKKRIEMVQFHQNYSYEDFIMGYKPVEGGSFSLNTGVFYDFCKKAEKDPSREYFFIIDEINRGNLSKIFGELLQLIEADYRKNPIKLAYKKEEFFSVPSNLYIIGMMNTADRSLAMIDYALRRRFSFFDMHPGFDTEGFHNYQKTVGSKRLNKLVECVKEVNKLILEDDSLGKGFQIGHSYLIENLEDSEGKKLIFDRELAKSIIEYDLIPLLEEYWFDNEAKMNQAKNTLSKAISDDN